MTGFIYVLSEIGETLWQEARKRPYVGGGVACVALLAALKMLLTIASILFASAPPRFAIAGDVLMDGQPLENGLVSFEDTADARPKAIAYVQKGAFALPGKHGLKAGTYKVRITQPAVDYSAWSPVREPVKAAGSKAQAPASKPPNSAAVPFIAPSAIPGRYNTQSELTVTVGRWSARKVRWDLSTSP